MSKYIKISAKKEIKVFRERAIADVFKEFKKLHEGSTPGNLVVVSINPDDLTYEEKRRALEEENMIKGKRNGMTGRSCANVSKKICLKEEEHIS